MKLLLSTFLFAVYIFYPAQKIDLRSDLSQVASWENLIMQHDPLNVDTIKAKSFLEPLKNRNTLGDQIIYDALIAKVYAKNFDKINETSNSLFAKSIRNAVKLGDQSLEVWSLLNYAEYLYNFRQMTEALPYFMSVTEKIENMSYDKILFRGESFSKIGFFMGTIGDNSLAVTYLNKALQHTKPNTSAYAMALDNVGIYLMNLGNYKGAEKSITEASMMAKSIGDEVRYAKTLGNLAQIYEKKGEIPRAVELVRQDISISEKNKSTQNTMFAYTLLARLLIANNQINEANEAIKYADAIAKSKSYFKINELDILKLKLKILNLEHREDEELEVRRRISVLEDSLNKTDGVLPLNQANWLMQKRKYQHNIVATKKELVREASLKNVIFAIAGLLIVLVLFIFIRSKNKLKETQLENERKIKMYEDMKRRNEQKLLDANKTLDAQIAFLKEKNIQIQKLREEIENFKESGSTFVEKDRSKLHDLLQSHLMTEENWLNFRREFEKEHPTFYKILQKDFPEITTSNLRIILLQKLGFTNSETAALLGITVDAVKKSKQRLKHKLGAKYDVLFKMMVSEN